MERYVRDKHRTISIFDAGSSTCQPCGLPKMPSKTVVGKGLFCLGAIPLWEKLEKIQKSGKARKSKDNGFGIRKDRVIAPGPSSGRIDIPVTIDPR